MQALKTKAHNSTIASRCTSRRQAKWPSLQALSTMPSWKMEWIVHPGIPPLTTIRTRHSNLSLVKATTRQATSWRMMRTLQRLRLTHRSLVTPSRSQSTSAISLPRSTVGSKPSASDLKLRSNSTPQFQSSRWAWVTSPSSRTASRALTASSTRCTPITQASSSRSQWKHRGVSHLPQQTGQNPRESETNQVRRCTKTSRPCKMKGRVAKSHFMTRLKRWSASKNESSNCLRPLLPSHRGSLKSFESSRKSRKKRKTRQRQRSMV